MLDLYFTFFEAMINQWYHLGLNYNQKLKIKYSITYIFQWEIIIISRYIS